MELTINGARMNVAAADDTPLLWALRDRLGMTGTKFGCGMALCGACTVHVDGVPTRACITPIAALAGKKIVTIEGIGATPQGKALQTAWSTVNVPQCGYCQSGQIMAAAALLTKNAQAERHGHRHCNDRQHLPLRHVSANPRGNQAGRRRSGEKGMSAQMVDRRAFLAGLGGLVLVASVSRIVKAADAPKYGADGMEHGWRDDPLLFVAIGEDGIVTVVVHRSEMGQGIRTGLPIVVADELDADWSKVRVTQAPGDEEKFGNQDTDGSRSMRHHFDPMRRVGAAARTMLEAAAAATWNVPVEFRARGQPRSRSRAERSPARLRRSRTRRGETARAAARHAAPQESLAVPLHRQGRHSAARCRRHLPRPRAVRHRHAPRRNAVRGDRALAGVRRQGGEVRCGGRASDARRRESGRDSGHAGAGAVPPLNGIAVIAEDTWIAMQARQALKIEWNDGPHGTYDSVAYRAELEQAARKPGKVLREVGDVDAAMAKAARKVEAEYYLPHLAHATMEPPSAAARIVDGRCEVWAPTQAPQATRERRRQAAGPATRQGHRARHAARRRVRSQIQAGLRDRGRASCRRQMGGRPVKVDVDARGRPASRLLPHGLRRAPARRARRAGQDDSMAASQCRADDRLDLRAGSEARSAVRAGHGADQRAVRRAEPAHRESGRSRAYAHRLVPLGFERAARFRRAVASCRSWPPLPGAIIAIFCSI